MFRTTYEVQTATNLAGGTFLAEPNVELVVEQGLVVGADINCDRQALQHDHFPIISKIIRGS